MGRGKKEEKKKMKNKQKKTTQRGEFTISRVVCRVQPAYTTMIIENRPHLFLVLLYRRNAISPYQYSTAVHGWVCSHDDNRPHLPLVSSPSIRPLLLSCTWVQGRLLSNKYSY